VIAEYVKVLQELAALKGLRLVPEEVLPLPKDGMVTLLQRSTHPNKEQLIGLLDMFNPTATFLFDMRTTLRYVPPAYLTYHQEATYVTSLSDRW
jgi:hypothetical protein